MSIFDLIEQRVALHRELFGDKPTHVALCQRHMHEAMRLLSTPKHPCGALTSIAGLTVFRSPIPNHLPYMY